MMDWGEAEKADPWDKGTGSGKWGESTKVARGAMGLHGIRIGLPTLEAFPKVGGDDGVANEVSGRSEASSR